MRSYKENTTKHSWVDVSKGIAICLMVVGHSSLPPVAGRWIFSFHMPFFFFISALFTNWDKDTPRQFILRKSKIFLIPFIIYSAINLILLPLSQGMSFSEYASEVLREGWGGKALWFVPVFFLSLLVCKMTPRRFVFNAGLLLLLAGSLLSEFNIILPWALSSVPFGAAIMLFTRYFRHGIRGFISRQTFTGWLIVMVAGLVASLFISHYFRLDMACNDISPTIPIIAGIIGGISVCVSLANLACRLELPKALLTHIGRNTYEIMVLSQVSILTAALFIPHMPILRYLIMIIVLVAAVYLRKFIEGKYSRVEAI